MTGPNPADRPTAPSSPGGLKGAGSGKSGKSGGATSTSAPNIAGRQWTSQQLLAWEWHPGFFASWQQPGPPLTAQEALAKLADGDGRPLLVLRECESCAGTEDAFLSSELDNEKTLLLGRWFHAIRFPSGVISPEHPMHVLFADESPAHLFVATADGTTRIDLNGRQSQAQLWGAMTSVLRKAYRKDPQSAVKVLRNLLDRLDGLDSRLAELDERPAAGKPPDSREARELEEERAELEARRLKLLEEGREADDLQLRQP